MVRVLLFAQMAAAVGARSLEWEVASPQSANAFWEWLLERCPELGEWRGVCRLACNGDYMGFDAEILAGDELAVIPPVSGG